jgi:hypothetical protein
MSIQSRGMAHQSFSVACPLRHTHFYMGSIVVFGCGPAYKRLSLWGKGVDDLCVPLPKLFCETLQ